STPRSGAGSTRRISTSAGVNASRSARSRHRFSSAGDEMSVTRVAALAAVLTALTAFTAQTPMSVPTYEVDPSWPRPLPNHWIVGAVVGVAVDSQDHIWITHRPSTLQ